LSLSPTLEGWLERLGMSSYLPILQQHGFGILAMLSVLDEETLNILDITLLAHCMQFLKKTKEMS
jgi:SAM domain (Sterile alpha motif)